MRKTYQFSLFGATSGKGLLFDRGVLAKYLSENEITPIPQLAEHGQLLRSWLRGLEGGEATEASLEAGFLSTILVKLLGYTLYPSSESVASLYQKPSARITRISRTPDAVLGEFSDTQTTFRAAVELKTPGTDLDLPQAREGSETPVEQGFYYGRRILGVRWVIVSDMRVIRLYSVESSTDYEELRLADCVDVDGNPTDTFRRFYFILHYANLIREGDKSPVSLLFAKTSERQLAIRDSFYEIYYRVRSDLYQAIASASLGLTPRPSPQDLLGATQRLLDRMLFIYYCEDHPQQLIPGNTVKRITEAARMVPGANAGKVYDALKALFVEIDKGSAPRSLIEIPAYNGELFKPHRILDNIALPDTLSDRMYGFTDPSGRARVISGVWGLHEFDFWTELNEHLLGHIFEQSLSDVTDGRLDGQVVTPDQRLAERKSKGIFYTSSTLSDFLAEGALRAVLDERAPVIAETTQQLKDSLTRRLEALRSLKVLDPACGSGAFLVSAYREMVEEYWRLRALAATATPTKSQSLFDEIGATEQAEMLRKSLFGVDLLPQAIEIAKLALWLRSARKGERVADLGGNLIAGDSLRISTFFEALGLTPESLDLVIGNPPWGGEIDPATRAEACAALGVENRAWDSWELFVLLGLRALRHGGRLAFVLPDSLLYEGKEPLRRLALAGASPEKVYNLGPDWFGKDVRMGTMAVQFRKGLDGARPDLAGGILSGALRAEAIRGRIPLTQIEAQRGRLIPIERVRAHPQFAIEVFRGKRDDAIMGMMEGKSTNLGDICTRARGEEMNKAGLAWICPSCLNPTVPGEKAKGGNYRDKKCPTCGLMLKASEVTQLSVIATSRPDNGDSSTYLDGDDLTRRYQRLDPHKWLRLGVPGWEYKEPSIYVGPKILVRQAGLGIVASLDLGNSRCPQSIYLYRLTPEMAAAGLKHEFVLAALLSRTMAYYIFKRFGETDPGKAHAKLTHERLFGLPIPRVDLATREGRGVHDEVVEAATRLLSGTVALGSEEDLRIESLLRTQWGLTSEDGAHVNREFIDIPDSQVIRDLFPNGVPAR